MSSIKDKILTAALLPTLVGAGVNPVRADIPRTPFRPNIPQRQIEESFKPIPPGPIEQAAQSAGRDAIQIQTEGKDPQDAELVRERIREDVNLFRDTEKQGPNARAYVLKELESGSHTAIAILDDTKTKIALMVGTVENGQLLMRGFGEDDSALRPVKVEGSTKELCASLAEQTQNAVTSLNKLTPPQAAK